MSILRIKDASGKFVAIPSIKGEKGDKGDAGSVTAVNGISPDGSGNVKLGAVQPRNLLDNSNFKNPVNQRNITDGQEVGKRAYFLDRWKSGSEAKTLTINENGIIFELMDQMLPEDTVPNGMTATAACMWSDGTVQTVTRTITRGDIWQNSVSGEKDGAYIAIVDMGTGETCARIVNSNGKTLVWAALYEGAYTADTLPPYVEKGYMQELLECQRYFYLLPNAGGGLSYGGYNNSADNARISVFTPVPMRIVPSVSVENMENLSIFSLESGLASVSAVEVLNAQRNGVALNVTPASPFQKNWTPVAMRLNTIVTLSADL